MRSATPLIVGALWASGSLGQGFVELEGRQFIVDGQPYYPMTMNFQFEVVSSNSAIAASDVYLSASSWYGGAGLYTFECNSQPSCSTQMAAMFSRVAAMGFNSIRVAGWATPHMTLGPLNEYNYDWYVRHNGFGGWSTSKTFSEPFANDAYANQCVALLRRLLDYADEAGLKVILLCAEDAGFTPAKDLTAAELYSRWLSFLAAGLQDHPALLAYDLWNEPVYSGPYDAWEMIQDVKGTYCEYTALWYDAIRAVDPNHLITLGGAHMGELAWWDPNAMKIDFYSPHMYPGCSFHDGYRVQESFDRFRSQVHWNARSCPMPFMIGEAGFAADDGTSHNVGANQYLSPDPTFHEWPYMHGTEAEQTQFVDEALQALEDNRGSGFSWWLFQNVHTMNLANAPVTDANKKQYREGFYGALRFGGNFNDPAMHKEFVDLVTSSYVPPQPTNALGQEPTNYYNYTNSPEPVVLTYHLEDLYGQPIENGFVQAVWSYTATGLGLTSEDLWDHCFSDANGVVEIHGQPDSLPGYSGPVRKRLDVDIPGGERLHVDQVWEADAHVFELEQAAMNFEDVIDGITISTNEAMSEKSWYRVLVNNTTVEGSGNAGGEFTAYARNVQLGPETHAQSGSELHIWAEHTFGDCSSNAYRSAQVNGIGANASQANREETATRVLQLQFITETPSFSIFPNPAVTEVTVQLQGIAAAVEVVLRDSGGRTARRLPLGPGTHSIPLSGLASGAYSLEATLDGVLVVERFTKLP